MEDVATSLMGPPCQIVHSPTGQGGIDGRYLKYFSGDSEEFGACCTTQHLYHNRTKLELPSDKVHPRT